MEAKKRVYKILVLTENSSKWFKVKRKDHHFRFRNILIQGLQKYIDAENPRLSLNGQPVGQAGRFDNPLFTTRRAMGG
jgi:hypothetical protein